MKSIVTILNYIDVAAPLVTLFFFIKPFSRLSRELRYIFWFVVVQFVTNAGADLMEALKTQNYTAYAVNIIFSFAILSLLFYDLRIPLIRKIVPPASAIFALVAIVSLVRGDGIATYNSIISALASFIITAYSLIFFYWRLVRDTRHSGLTEHAFFWITIGIFTYYTGSFFIFISYKYLIDRDFDSVGILWRFHNVLLTIFCIYTIYGVTCKNYQKT